MTGDGRKSTRFLETKAWSGADHHQISKDGTKSALALRCWSDLSTCLSRYDAARIIFAPDRCTTPLLVGWAEGPDRRDKGQGCRVTRISTCYFRLLVLRILPFLGRAGSDMGVRAEVIGPLDLKDCKRGLSPTCITAFHG